MAFGALIKNAYTNYANYLWSEITFQSIPWYQNYFWLLILLSVVVWILELVFPWRKNQPSIRKGFWVDAFYMFFNFFIFNLIIFIAFSSITTHLFKDVFDVDFSKIALINLQDFPAWFQLVVFFVATDFIQWFTHVLLHRFPFLWKFHKVHHSVEEMGFAAHLRYHWMENVFYTPMKYIMVMLIGGFAPEQAFIVYYFAIIIGHINHANIGISYGPLKYILNNPKMHIWHHAYDLPEGHSKGVNFGITLSIWDYIFRTNYIPSSGKDIRLGFKNIEKYPKSFFKQLYVGFFKEE
jgi:sterol desaturase/sphingolipid hydroxylase (fatty acid hydroxylase superfamily)